MNKRIKAKWLKALRSGKYKQGKNALRNGDQFCCLGVLCDLYAKTKRHKTQWRGLHFLGQQLDLPKKVMAWAGLESPNARYTAGMSTSLALDNDSGSTFIAIADIIEREF